MGKGCVDDPLRNRMDVAVNTRVSRTFQGLLSRLLKFSLNFLRLFFLKKRKTNKGARLFNSVFSVRVYICVGWFCTEIINNGFLITR